MNELRLQYQRDTGHRVNPDEIVIETGQHCPTNIYLNDVKILNDSFTVYPAEYVEWLEDKLMKTLLEL